MSEQQNWPTGKGAGWCKKCHHYWMAHAPTVPGCAQCDCKVPSVPMPEATA